MDNPIRVLIIDDEPLLRASLKDYFEDEGATVLEASNGAEGVETCLKQRPDLVVTDLRMPVMDGFGVIEHLKQTMPDTPIIVISGQGTINDVISAVRLGAWDYISKPILKLDELTLVVQRVMERSRLLAENKAYHERLEELVQERTRQIEEVATKYRIVADHTYGWEFWINPAGEFIYSSPSCLRVTGHSIDEFMGDPKLLLKIIHPDDVAIFHNHSHESLIEREDGMLEFRIIHPDGSVHWIHHNCQPVYDDQGVFLGTRGSNRDITSRRLAEEAHKKSEQRLSAIFDFLPDATWAIDTNGVVIAWNKACRELTGVTALEMVGKGNYSYAIPFYGVPRPMLIDLALNPSADLLEPYLDGYTSFTIEAGSITAESAGLLLSKGRYLWWKASRLYDINGKVSGAIESVRDITELRLSKEAALASNHAKSAFLATMSHELRTPLNAIIGFTDLIRIRGCGEINASQEEYLEYVLDSSRHLLALINDILDLSKIEAGKMELHLSDVDIRVLLEASLVVIKSRADKHRIQVCESFNELLPATVRIDPLKIKQVLINLLSNAVKFTPSGGSITLTTTMATHELLKEPPHRRELKAGSYLLITVTDTGIGIKKEDLQRIFEPFEQSDNSSTRQHEGTGLGLSLSKMMAELHGGTIWADSSLVGGGSSFHLALPLHIEASI